jgi:hypothetical protein
MIPLLPDFLIPLSKGIVFFSSLITLILAELAINRMSPCSPFLARFAFHCLAVGGAGNLVWVALGDSPQWPEAVMGLGVALLLGFDRIRPRSGDRRRNGFRRGSL